MLVFLINKSDGTISVKIVIIALLVPVRKIEDRKGFIYKRVGQEDKGKSQPEL